MDYISVNSIMKLYKWPLPRLEEVFDELSGGQCFLHWTCSQVIGNCDGSGREVKDGILLSFWN